MIRIPKGTSRYHYRFSFQGKVFSGTTGTSNKTLAAQFERRVREEAYRTIALGEDRTEHITLRRAIEQYFEDTKHEPVIKTYQTLRTKTLGTKQCNRTFQQVSVFGLPDVAIDTLKNRDIQQLITKRRAEGNGTASIIYELVFLSVVFKHVKRLGFQVPDIDFDELKSANKLRAPKGRLRFLNAEEEQKLLLELASTLENDSALSKMQRTEVLHMAVMLLDFGCRLGELANLKWTDVDMSKKQISLYRTKVKNESTLAMTDRVHTLLAARLSVKPKQQVYIFEGRNGGPVRNARKSFKNACVRAGLKDVSFHTLRHSHASKLVQNGVSLYVVQSQLGHASASTTERYAHLMPTKATEQVASVLNQLQGAFQ